jgi:hypothetical protein
MDIHTDIVPVISITSPTIAMISSVIPLAWKLEQLTAEGFYLKASRAIETHNESWNINLVVPPPSASGQQLVSFSLQVWTMVSDRIVFGEPYGWSSIITSTGRLSIDAETVRSWQTDESKEQEFRQLILDLCDMQKARRDAMNLAVSNG